jgi:hypothetical protein
MSEATFSVCGGPNQAALARLFEQSQSVAQKVKRAVEQYNHWVFGKAPNLTVEDYGEDWAVYDDDCCLYIAPATHWYKTIAGERSIQGFEVGKFDDCGDSPDCTTRTLVDAIRVYLQLAAEVHIDRITATYWEDDYEK